MPSNRPRSPLWATVNVTGKCNLTCEYCFFQPRKHQHMEFEDFRTVIEALQARGLFFLTISGGEPFVHPRITNILQLAHDRFEHATVLSNGSAFRDTHFECIGDIVSKKGCFPIQVSLDAVDSEINDSTRGMTEVVMRNLAKLSELGASLTIAIVVSSQNIDQVVRTILETKHLTRHFHLMPFKPVPYLDEADGYLKAGDQQFAEVWARLSRLREEHGLHIRLPSDECQATSFSATGAPCVAGFTQFVVDPDLDVRACSRCTHAVVGNLATDTVEEIWNGSRLAHIYKRDVPYCHVRSEWKKAVEDPAFLRGKRGAATERRRDQRQARRTSPEPATT